MIENRAPVVGYCDGCPKIVDGLCSVYANPRLKTAADRGVVLGCAFSPKEKPKEEKTKTRVGQAKGRRGKRKRC